MREPLFVPVSDTEMKLRTKLKTFFLCEEDETPSFEDIAILVGVGVVSLWAVLLGLSVMF